MNVVVEEQEEGRKERKCQVVSFILFYTKKKKKGKIKMRVDAACTKCWLLTPPNCSDRPRAKLNAKGDITPLEHIVSSYPFGTGPYGDVLLLLSRIW